MSAATTTYRSLAEGLPPEMAQQIHPDWYRYEAEYWAVRDSLVEEYRNQWIGFANGKVICSGRSPVKVLHEADRLVPHSFFVCVGREYEPTRMRHSTFPYDKSYPGEPLPVATVEFRPSTGRVGLVLDDVILDTGSDASALPLNDLKRLKVDPAGGRPVHMGGVGGSTTLTVQYNVVVFVDGNEYPCRVQVDSFGDERIIGRDVLRHVEVLFRGPAAEVIINP